MVTVFVYGSLKRGYALHHLLASQAFLGVAVARPDYRLFDLGDYPGLVQVETAAGELVVGELYDVDAVCLKQLDEAECVDSGLYERRQIFLQPPHAAALVQAYFYLGSVQGCSDCGPAWP